MNLETLLFLKQNKLKYFSLEKIINKQFHESGIISVEKILNKIKSKSNLEFFLQKRYLGALRKYLNSIFLIIKIVEHIQKKHNIKTIYLSGWNSKNFKNIKNNFTVSEIVYELYKKKFKIKLLSKFTQKSKNLTKHEKRQLKLLQQQQKK